MLAYAFGICDLFGPGGCSSIEYIATTNDDFVTKNKTKVSEDADDVVVGFLTVSGQRTLAAAQDKGALIRFLRRD